MSEEKDWEEYDRDMRSVDLDAAAKFKSICAFVLFIIILVIASLVDGGF